MRWLNLVIAVFGLAVCLPASGVAQSTNQDAPPMLGFDPGQIFDEVTQTVADHFYAPDFDQAAWQAAAERFRPQAVAAASHDKYDLVLNQLLGTLNTSHTQYFSKRNPRRYQLLGIFNKLFDNTQSDLFVYEGIGIRTQNIDGTHGVIAAFDGFPAKKAGLKYGDQIISVNGQPFHPIDSFTGMAGRRVEVLVRRGNEEAKLTPKVVHLDGRTIFETALTESQRIIERNGGKIAYIHIWSYAGAQYQELLRESLLWGDLSQCDSLVLDIRDGWGGADPNYLSLFRQPIVDVASKSRTGEIGSYTGVWGKPISLLTNERSTSGKELFTFGFKKLGLGQVVGETTAGAVVAGRCFLLPNEDALYLAVRDVTVDGIRLEGVGVKPDVHVPRPVNSRVSSDPQLDAAIKILGNLEP